MAISKVILNGTTQMDLTDTTAVASDVASGKVFFLADGTQAIGTNEGGGGGSTAQIATGSVTGDGTITLDISCNFAPDLIYVYGDMSDSANNRGIVSITIVKDTVIYVSNDSSTSNTNENGAYIAHGISGYGSTSSAHATYSNETLTLDTVTNSSAYRFRSGQTYNYRLIKWTA